MKNFLLVFLTFVSLPALAQEGSAPKVILGPDYILHVEIKAEKLHTVLGPMKTDANGKATGSFAVYGGSSLVQVSSLSFSSDSRTLAVGSTPGTADIWNLETHGKLTSLPASSTLAISPDGHLLATWGRDIKILDLTSQKAVKTLPRGTGATIWRMSFDPEGTRLLVRANGQDDTVYDVKTGQKLASLLNTQEAQFSRDGLIAVGGNSKHVISWSTNDWSQVGDIPNGPDYVTRFALSPNKDLVVVGGPNSARLIRLSTGEEVAKIGTGYTNFAAFDQTGAFVFTYSGSGSGFGIWTTTGRLLCTLEGVGGTMELSPDGHWLATAHAGGSRDVELWDVSKMLSRCH
jgi:WD40 repeat protein